MVDGGPYVLIRMCTSLFTFAVHPGILFLLTFNRDEYYDRYMLKLIV